ncbi:SNF2 family N-terminal domain-containing protein [Phlebopus sp. FC_14]|nr:SNF2 family N-terminal domain-containing protein [Phlebopus sp. FC_14]
MLGHEVRSFPERKRRLLRVHSRPVFRASVDRDIFNVTIMAGSSGSSTKKVSRVLAALDGSDLFAGASTSNGDAPQVGIQTVLGKRHLNGEIAPSSQNIGAHYIQEMTALIRGRSSFNKPKVNANATSSSSVSVGASGDVDGSPPNPQNVEIQSKLALSGFSLRYDTETPVRRIDIGGADQEQRMAEFVYNSINNLSEGQTVQGAIERLGLQSDKDLLPGLEIRLLPHQLIGVRWMVEQEKKSPHKGGILADEMGLGKTIQMIATMAANLPKGKDARTSLIVVPAALLQQWKEELETKTNDLFTVHIHHGRDKLATVADVHSKDVIITTYQTLSAELMLPPDLEDGEELAWLEEQGGVLGRVRWYRVILDEAQFIRNRGTLASRSVALLRANYRWMLTGTPVTNTLADIYGLIRFGRFRPWNDWNDFNVYVAKQQHQDPPLAAMRAQEILKPLLLRRTKDAELDGKRILQLPTKHIELVTLEFSADERELYDKFEKRSHVQINRFIKNRTLLKNSTAVLSHAGEYEDPSLLMSDDKDKERGRALKIMGAAWVSEIKKRFLKRALANDMFIIFSDEADEAEVMCPVCKDLYMNNSGRVLACGHELCFDCLLELSNSPIAHNGEFGHGTEQENIRAEKEYEAAAAKGHRPCPVCKKMTDLTQHRVFQFSAFEPEDDELQEAARAAKRARRSGPSTNAILHKKPVVHSDDSDYEPRAQPVKSRFRGGTPVEDSSDDEMPDFSQLFANGGVMKKKAKKAMKNGVRGEMGKKKGKGKDVGDDDMLDLTLDSSELGSDESVTETPPQSSQRSSQPSRSQSVNGKDKQMASANDDKDKDKEPSAPSGALIAMWRKGDYDLEPSSKMLALIDLLKEADAAGDKAICFSQWTSMLDLVEILLSRYGIRSLRYDGQMDRVSRDKALTTFKRHDGPKVILISTKCGGVGLNLVAANRIINLDLSWNYASESQAYDRVHRLGQEKEVFIKRLVVKDTIEERMLRLQEVKTDLADAALGEGSGVKLHKMSVKEIKALFGMKA